MLSGMLPPSFCTDILTDIHPYAPPLTQPLPPLVRTHARTHARNCAHARTCAHAYTHTRAACLGTPLAHTTRPRTKPLACTRTLAMIKGHTRKTPTRLSVCSVSLCSSADFVSPLLGLLFVKCTLSLPLTSSSYSARNSAQIAPYSSALNNRSVVCRWTDACAYCHMGLLRGLLKSPTSPRVQTLPCVPRSPGPQRPPTSFGQDSNYLTSSLLNRTSNLAYSSPNYASPADTTSNYGVSAAGYRSASPAFNYSASPSSLYGTSYAHS